MVYAYKKLKFKDGSTKDEHRHIVEKQLGRKLNRNEVVHHIDGNKLNNSVDNLEVMSLAEHARQHQKENWKCPEYRKNFIAKAKEIAAKKKETYVYTCKILPQNLIQLALEAWPCSGASLRTFSKHYNISRNAMTKLLRSEGLL